MVISQYNVWKRNDDSFLVSKGRPNQILKCNRRSIIISPIILYQLYLFYYLYNTTLACHFPNPKKQNERKVILCPLIAFSKMRLQEFIASLISLFLLFIGKSITKHLNFDLYFLLHHLFKAN